MSPPVEESNRAPVRRRRPAWWPWHQRLGITFSVVIVAVVLTGIALNHTGGLRLDERRITNAWVLDWYGMNPEGEPIAFEADGWALQWDEQLYWDGQPVEAETGQLVGAVALLDIRVIATTDALFLLTPTGELIERMDAVDLPPGSVKQIGNLNGNVMLTSTEGKFLSDPDVGEWDRYQLAADVHWSEAEPVPATEREAALQSYRGQGVSLYRVLLDLHSGRLFGSIGVWVVDAAAVAILFLTLTGVWYALRVKRR